MRKYIAYIIVALVIGVIIWLFILIAQGNKNTTMQNAQLGNNVTVHYQGMLEDGSIFDSSYKRNEPFSFNLGAGEVIKGWDEGVVGMHIGEKKRLVVPPEKGYGEYGMPPVIPPNASLIFDIEMIEIK